MKNYIVIGDSITYGLGDLENCGWAAMFKKYVIRNDNISSSKNLVHVAGFPGATSRDILPKLDAILDSFKDDVFDNVVILSIGINDTKYFNGDFDEVESSFKQSMSMLIKNIINRGFDLIVLGITGIELDNSDYNPNKFYDRSNLKEYENDLKIIKINNNVIEDLCNQNKITYIPMQDVLQKGDFADGLHPNEEGHKKIFDVLIHHINK